MEFGGLALGFQRRFHFVDLLDLDARVLGAVEAEHRLLDLRGKVDRTFGCCVAPVGDRSVKRHAGFEIRIVRGVMPDIAAAAAETHDA